MIRFDHMSPERSARARRVLQLWSVPPTDPRAVELVEIAELQHAIGLRGTDVDGVLGKRTREAFAACPRPLQVPGWLIARLLGAA